MSSASDEPPNFSWVERGKLAGLACPSEPRHYRFLWENGVRHLVCLLEAPPSEFRSCPRLVLHHIPIVDFSPPSPAQIRRFLSIVDETEREAVAVHCAHGHGRTGTMLACYLVHAHGLTGEDAITEIRRLRPGSVETREQEIAVIDFYRHVTRPRPPAGHEQQRPSA